VGKRGDKRRARGRRRRIRQPDVEGFQFGPLTVERHGKNIVSRVDTSHADYEEYRELTDARLAELPRELGRLRDELRQLFTPFDAFDVIAYLWLMNVPSDPETYKESTDEGLLAIPEVAAAILIERQSRGVTDEAAFFGEIAEEAQKKLKEYLQVQAFIYLDEASKRHEDDPAYGEIRGLARSHRLAVRGPTYWWQEHQTIRDLFEDDVIRPLVKDAAGFTAAEGIALTEAMSNFGLEQLRKRALEARDFADRLIEEDARVRAGKPGLHPEYEGILKNLNGLSRADSVKRVHELALGWAGFATGSVFELTADALAKDADVDVATAGAFLERFSMVFGTFADRNRLPDIEDLRDRPILADGNGNHICVSPHNVLWGLRQQLEAALKENPKNFNAYERHRARLIEERAVGALANALQADWSYTGLYYEVSEDGQKKRIELDGIVRLDSVVYLVEVKASSMRPAARRAAPEALRDWLKDELSKAATQVRRTRDTLFGATPAFISDEKGKPVKLDLDGVEDVVELVVTLEDLAATAPLSWKLADAGLVPDDPVPWVVSLHELEIICEVAARPAELVHYTLRRQRLNRRRDAWALDELDYFMHYLLAGLYWEGEKESAPVSLLSHTDELDAYYASVTGQRKKKAKRPSPNHPNQVEALLQCLDDLDAPGRLDAALAILDVDVPVRERVAGDLRRLRKESARDGMFHDRTYFCDDFGITIMSAPTSAADELPAKLHAYCLLKKHQSRANRWIGFGVFSGPRAPVQIAVVFREPWQPDPELDRIVEKLPSYGVEGDFDGRKHVDSS
jgi:hypothetical protein